MKDVILTVIVVGILVPSFLYLQSINTRITKLEAQNQIILNFIDPEEKVTRVAKRYGLVPSSDKKGFYYSASKLKRNDVKTINSLGVDVIPTFLPRTRPTKVGAKGDRVKYIYELRIDEPWLQRK